MMNQREKFFWTSLIFLLVIIFAAIVTLLGFLPEKNNGQPFVQIGEARWEVEVADDLIEQAKGLADRDSLASDRGMLFLFNKPDQLSFWMRGMRFPIDIIWIRGERVVGISPNLQPASFRSLETFSPPEPADKVLEINTGQAAQFGIKVGDWIKVNL